MYHVRIQISWDFEGVSKITFLYFSIIVGQGPTVLAVGAGGWCLAIFLSSSISSLSTSLWEMA